MAVIDTDLAEIVGRVKVGPRPIHAYAVPWRNEFWTHPDGRGEFDVIHCDNIFEVDAERIQANVDTASICRRCPTKYPHECAGIGA